MKVAKSGAVLGLSLAAGVALACSVKAMPPMIVDVSLWDMTVAAFMGYDNPARAAALMEVDEKGAAAVGGAATWYANGYTGPVTYKVGSGYNIVTEEKPCNSKAIDTLEDPDEEEDAEEHGENGGSGGFAGYYWANFRIFSSGGTCLYGCGRVTVGEVDPQ